MTGQMPRVAFVLLVGLLTIAGCEQPEVPRTTKKTGDAGATSGATDEVDPHDIPLTVAEVESLKGSLTSYEGALTKIKGYRDAIREAIATGNASEAHRPLDELEIVLGHLPTVARETNIPRSQWETINISAQHIRELFNQVHKTIDAGEKPDFKTVSEEIDVQISALEGVAVE